MLYTHFIWLLLLQRNERVRFGWGGAYETGYRVSYL